MTTRSERPLGAEASVYIRERLITGKSLAHALHEALDIESGRVFGYLPDSLPDERAHQFRYGGIWPTPPESTWLRAGGGIMIPTPNAVEWLTSRALDFLSRTTKAFVVFEEWTARPSDPFWGRQPEHREAATFVGDEVYYVVSSDDRKRVQDAIE